MKMVATSAPRTPMVADVAVEIVAEVLQRALQRFGRSRRERAVGVPGAEQARMGRQSIEIAGLAGSRFESAQQIGDPVQSRPAGRAPPARFLREELFEVAHHADRARAIVE